MSKIVRHFTQQHNDLITCTFCKDSPRGAAEHSSRLSFLARTGRQLGSLRPPAPHGAAADPRRTHLSAASLCLSASLPHPHHAPGLGLLVCSPFLWTRPFVHFETPHGRGLRSICVPPWCVSLSVGPARDLLSCRICTWMHLPVQRESLQSMKLGLSVRIEGDCKLLVATPQDATSHLGPDPLSRTEPLVITAGQIGSAAAPSAA